MEYRDRNSFLLEIKPTNFMSLLTAGSTYTLKKKIVSPIY